MAEEEIKPLLTLEEVKEYLTIDHEDETPKKNLERFILVADKYLEGSIGKDYPKDDERAKQLALFIIEDLFDRGSYNVKENQVLIKMKSDFSLQLRCERRNEVI